MCARTPRNPRETIFFSKSLFMLFELLAAWQKIFSLNMEEWLETVS